MQVTDTLTKLLDTVLQAIPTIVVFLLILLVGWIVAKVVKGIVSKVLSRIGLDRTLHNNQYGQYVEKASPGASPSRLIGSIVYFFVLLGALSVAISYTQNPGLTAMLASIYGYLPKVVAAILIFVIAAAVSGAVGGLVERTMGDTGTGQIVQTVVPVIVMSIAVFMILEQLEIAPEIVRILFTALIGSLALGLALAFGLGGRGVAERLLEKAYDKGDEKQEEARRDYELAKERGQQDYEQAKGRAQQEHQARAGGDTAGGTQQAPQPGSGRPAGEPAPGGAPRRR